MQHKFGVLLTLALATTAFAASFSIPTATMPLSSPTVSCWPDESAKTCWQHAEYRRHP